MARFIRGVIFVLAGLALSPLAYASEAEDYHQALAEYQQGQYPQAVQDFQRVIQENPNSWQAYQGLGSALLHQGDKQAALEAYQKSLALHPDNPTISSAVGKLSNDTELSNSAAASSAPQPTPSTATLGERLSLIEIRRGGTDKNPTESYYYQNKALENYQQIKDLIDPLHDPEASRLLKDSESKETGSLVAIIGGSLLAGGGLIYAITEKGTTQATTVSGPFGSTYVNYSTTAPDSGPAWLLTGAGVLSGFLGVILHSDSGQEKHQAVARYNKLVGPDQYNIPAASVASTGKDQTNVPAANTPSAQPAAQEASPGNTATPSIQSPPASPTPQATVPLFGLGASPLMNFPISNKTSSEYVTGFGGEVNLNYILDKNFSVGLNASSQSLPVNRANFANMFQQTYGIPLPAGVSISGGWDYVPITAQIKFSLPSPNSQFTPYVFWGGGVAFNRATASASYSGQNVTVSTTETDFLVTQGLGFGIHPDPSLEIFAECRLDIDFTTQNGTDSFTVTTNSGNSTQNGNLSDDGPTLFLPVEIGVRYWQ